MENTKISTKDRHVCILNTNSRYDGNWYFLIHDNYRGNNDYVVVEVEPSDRPITVVFNRKNVFTEARLAMEKLNML